VQNLGEDIALERSSAAREEARGVEDRPSLIIVRTHIGYGSPHKQDTYRRTARRSARTRCARRRRSTAGPPDRPSTSRTRRASTSRRPRERGGTRWTSGSSGSRLPEDDAGAARSSSCSCSGRCRTAGTGGAATFEPDDGSVATRKASSR
jgi:transketolase